MFQSLKLINFKPISSGFFIFFRFISGVGCVGCFFPALFSVAFLPNSAQATNQLPICSYFRANAFARSWPVSLRLFAYLNDYLNDYFEHHNIYRVLHDLKSQKSCRNGSVNSMRAYPSRAFV